MNKSESKYFNTAIRMDEALTELLETKDFEYISIKEICAAAGVNRSTFYLHYENTRELLEESVSLMHSRFMSYFDVEARDFVAGLQNCSREELMLITPQYLTPYLTYIREHKRLYSAAMRNPGNFQTHNTYNRMFQHVFDPILARFQVPEEEKSYVMAFYLNGISAIVSQWLEEDCKMPLETVAKIIMDCIPGA